MEQWGGEEGGVQPVIVSLSMMVGEGEGVEEAMQNLPSSLTSWGWWRARGSSSSLRTFVYPLREDLFASLEHCFYHSCIICGQLLPHFQFENNCAYCSALILSAPPSAG